MDFREHVQVEASALVSRLQADTLARAREAQQSLRQAVEAAVAAAEAAIDAPAALDEEVGALVEKIEAAAQARVEAAAERVSADLQSAADASREALEALQQELEVSRGALDSLRQELDAVRHEGQASQQELEGARQLVDEAGEALERSRVESERLATELAEARAEVDRLEDEVNAVQAQAQQAAIAPLDLLLDAMRRFAAARSVGDVLTVLVESLAQDLGRAALFSVQGTRLEGVRQVGFEFASDISKLAVPLGIDSVLSDAVSSGRVQGLLGPGLTARTRALFGGKPSFAVVVPVVIKGEALAVIYADDAEGTSNEAVRPEQRMKLAELLLCQAVPRLPALLRLRQAISEHANHARALLERIEQAYVSDREAGAPSSELQVRLEGRLAQAREIHERAAGQPGEAASIFDEQLRLLLTRQHASPFGRDLAVVTTRAGSAAAPDQGAAVARA